MTDCYRPVQWLPDQATVLSRSDRTSRLAAAVLIVLALGLPHLIGGPQPSASQSYDHGGVTAIPDGRGKWTGYM